MIRANLSTNRKVALKHEVLWPKLLNGPQMIGADFCDQLIRGSRCVSVMPAKTVNAHGDSTQVGIDMGATGQGFELMLPLSVNLLLPSLIRSNA